MAMDTFKHWASDVAPLFARTLSDDQAFFSSFLGPNYLRYLVLLMIDGYGETDWPSA